MWPWFAGLGGGAGILWWLLRCIFGRAARNAAPAAAAAPRPVVASSSDSEDDGLFSVGRRRPPPLPRPLPPSSRASIPSPDGSSTSVENAVPTPPVPAPAPPPQTELFASDSEDGDLFGRPPPIIRDAREATNTPTSILTASGKKVPAGGVNIFNSAVTAAINEPKSPSRGPAGVTLPQARASVATSAQPTPANSSELQNPSKSNGLARSNQKSSEPQRPASSFVTPTVHQPSLLPSHTINAPSIPSSAAAQPTGLGLFDDDDEDDDLFGHPPGILSTASKHPNSDAPTASSEPVDSSRVPVMTQQRAAQQTASKTFGGSLFSSDEDDPIASALTTQPRAPAAASAPQVTPAPPVTPAPEVKSETLPPDLSQAPPSRPGFPVTSTRTAAPDTSDDDDLFSTSVRAAGVQPQPVTVAQSSTHKIASSLVSVPEPHAPSKPARVTNLPPLKSPVIKSDSKKTGSIKERPKLNDEPNVMKSGGLFSSESDDDLFSAAVKPTVSSSALASPAPRQEIHSETKNVQSSETRVSNLHQSGPNSINVSEAVKEPINSEMPKPPATASPPVKEAPVIIIPAASNPAAAPATTLGMVCSSSDDEFLPNRSSLATPRNASVFAARSSDEEIFPSIPNVIGITGEGPALSNTHRNRVSVPQPEISFDSTQNDPAMSANLGSETPQRLPSSDGDDLFADVPSTALGRSGLSQITTLSNFTPSDDDDLFASVDRASSVKSPETPTSGLENATHEKDLRSSLSGEVVPAARQDVSSTSPAVSKQDVKPPFKIGDESLILPERSKEDTFHSTSTGINFQGSNKMLGTDQSDIRHDPSVTNRQEPIDGIKNHSEQTDELDASASSEDVSSSSSPQKKRPVGGVALFGGSELLARVNRRRQNLDAAEASSSTSSSPPQISELRPASSQPPGAEQHMPGLSSVRSSAGPVGSSNGPVSPPAVPVSPPAVPVSPPAVPVSPPAVPVSPPAVPVSPPAVPLSPSAAPVNPSAVPVNHMASTVRKRPPGAVSLFGNQDGGAELFAKLRKRQNKMSESEEESISPQVAASPSSEEEHSVPVSSARATKAGVASASPTKRFLASQGLFAATPRAGLQPAAESASSFDEPASIDALTSLNKERPRMNRKRPPSRRSRGPTSTSISSDSDQLFGNPSQAIASHAMSSEASSSQALEPNQVLEAKQRVFSTEGDHKDISNNNPNNSPPSTASDPATASSGGDSGVSSLKSEANSPKTSDGPDDRDSEATQNKPVLASSKEALFASSEDEDFTFHLPAPKVISSRTARLDESRAVPGLSGKGPAKESTTQPVVPSLNKQNSSLLSSSDSDDLFSGAQPKMHPAGSNVVHVLGNKEITPASVVNSTAAPLPPITLNKQPVTTHRTSLFADDDDDDLFSGGAPPPVSTTAALQDAAAPAAKSFPSPATAPSHEHKQPFSDPLSDLL